MCFALLHTRITEDYARLCFQQLWTQIDRKRVDRNAYTCSHRIVLVADSRTLLSHLATHLDTINTP